MFHMSFTYVLHARPLRICIRTPSSALIDRSPGSFWDSAMYGYGGSLEISTDNGNTWATKFTGSATIKHIAFGNGISPPAR